MYPNMMSSISSVAPVASTSKGLFSKLLGGGLNWGSILNTTQKTLGLVNQAIPVIKQVSPVMKNAKTIFKVMNEFKKVDTPPTNITPSDSNNENKTINDTIQTNNLSFDGAPTFFIN